MKAYNSPTDELHIKSNSGEELVKITPNETTIKNMDLSSTGIKSTPEEVDAAVKKASTIPDNFEDVVALSEEIYEIAKRDINQYIKTLTIYDGHPDGKYYVNAGMPTDTENEGDIVRLDLAGIMPSLYYDSPESLFTMGFVTINLANVQTLLANGQIDGLPLMINYKYGTRLAVMLGESTLPVYAYINNGSYNRTTDTYSLRQASGIFYEDSISNYIILILYNFDTTNNTCSARAKILS